MRNGFPPGVSEKIGWYVYRLIDPRNGETFYVGKGQGDRIFHHAQGALGEASQHDEADLKLTRIREIRISGLEVSHVVHQHGIPNQETAFRIEAAVMDCFSGLTNSAAGHGAGEFGARHVEQIISDYAATEFVPLERILAISIGQSYLERSIYEAVRGIWKTDIERAGKMDLVLAVVGSIVRGVYRPTQWVAATAANFPWLEKDEPGRIGFIGKEAEPSVLARYMNHRMPANYPFSQNPVRYLEPIPAGG